MERVFGQPAPGSAPAHPGDGSPSYGAPGDGSPPATAATAGPRWPWWYAPAGLVLVFFWTIFLASPLVVAAAVIGMDRSDPPAWLTLSTVALQDAALIGTPLALAWLRGRPRAWHFGLRRTRLWPALGWSALGLGGFWVFAAVYQLVVGKVEQTTLKDLGVTDGLVSLVAIGVLVAVVAPIAEELFFRGFFYRALRSRLGVGAAAAVDGVFFGAVHAFTGLEAVPVLAVLGFVFCLLYERLGSLYPVIALHALVNTIAYAEGTGTPAGVAVALACGVTTIAACMLLPRFTRPAPPPGPALPPGPVFPATR